MINIFTLVILDIFNFYVYNYATNHTKLNKKAYTKIYLINRLEDNLNTKCVEKLY